MKNTVTITIEEYDELRRIRDEIYKGNVLEVKARYSSWSWINPALKHESYCNFEIVPKSKVDEFLLAGLEKNKQEMEDSTRNIIRLNRIIDFIESTLSNINILNFNKKANNVLKKIKER